MPNKFMAIRSAANEITDSIDHFIRLAAEDGLSDERIASEIIDIIYNYQTSLYREIQRQMLPMVKEFELSKSMDLLEIEKDWDHAITMWEQKQMWKIISK